MNEKFILKKKAISFYTSWLSCIQMKNHNIEFLIQYLHVSEMSVFVVDIKLCTL